MPCTRHADLFLSLTMLRSRATCLFGVAIGWQLGTQVGCKCVILRLHPNGFINSHVDGVCEGRERKG